MISNSRYYEGGVSSVYFWDLDDGFAGVVLLKKSPILLIVLTYKADTGYSNSQRQE